MKTMKFFSYCMVALSLGFASCSSSDEPETENNGTAFGKLTLISDKNFVEANGTDQVKFKVVTADGIEVTEDAQIIGVIDGVPLAGNSFSTSKTGDYEFMAKFKGELTSELEVKAIGKALEMPEDSNPLGANYRRRVLGLQFTSTYCVFCPTVIAAIHNYDNSLGNVVFAAAHSNMGVDKIDPMTNVGSLLLMDSYLIRNLPSLMFDFDKNMLLESNATSVKIDEIVTEKINEKPQSGISVSVKLEGDIIKVQSDVKVSQSGSYKLGMWVLEDGIEAKQANQTGLEGNFNIHNNAIRAINFEAKPQAPGVDVAIDGKYAHYCEFSKSALNIKNIEKCHVVVFITDKKGKLDNVVNCPINASVAFEYK